MPGVSAQPKGLAIVIDGRLYKKEDFNSLPHGLTLENTSTVIINEGVVFQGHNNPLSNMYQRKLTDQNGRSANSAEQLFCIRMVEECGADLALQTQIKPEQNPYNVKAMAKRIRKNDKWNKSSKDILAEIVEL